VKDIVLLTAKVEEKTAGMWCRLARASRNASLRFLQSQLSWHRKLCSSEALEQVGIQILHIGVNRVEEEFLLLSEGSDNWWWGPAGCESLGKGSKF
jgi:hypothetical protein